MPQDLLRSALGARLGTAARLGFAILGLTSAGFLVRLAIPLSRDLLLSTLPALCSAVRGYLVPPYIFVVVNFMIFVILKLPDTKNRHHKESPGGGGAAAAAAAAAADPPKPRKDLPHFSPREVSLNAWSDAAALALQPASSPKAGDSSPSAWSDESSLTTDFEGDSAASSPAEAAVLVQSSAETGVRPSDEPPPTGEVGDEDDHDSLEATWKAITGGETGRRQLKRNETWSAPPRVHLEPAGGGPALQREMRKSETFRQSPSPATGRVAVERMANWRDAPMAEDHDDINRQFEAFIKKGKDQMRLQREESAAQRYMEMVKSPGY